MRALLNAVALAVLAFYLVLLVPAFLYFVNPSLEGRNHWRVAADSITYLGVASAIENGSEITRFISVTQNLMMPTYQAIILGSNTNIALFNVALFLLSLFILVRTFKEMKLYIFLPLVLLTPLTFAGLLTLNKEIFVFFSAVLFLNWLVTRNKFVFLFLALFSLVLRWEQAFIIVSFAILLKLPICPKKVFILLVVVMSAVFPIVHSALNVPEYVRSELIMKLNFLQDKGLFFLIFIPKLLIALTSQLVRWWPPLFEENRIYDLQNGFFVTANQLCMTGLAIWVWRKDLWRIHNKLVYFVVIHVLVLCAAPLNQPRYYYMLYIVVAAFVATPELQTDAPVTTAVTVERLYQRVGRFLMVEKLSSYRILRRCPQNHNW